MMPATRAIDVVFVHGLFSSGEVWKPFKQLIAGDPDLADFANIHCFEYDSPFIRLRLDRRIAETDDIADLLRTYLSTELRDAESIVLVTHSQGGLVVQRFLARALRRGEGRDLARIKRILMYACPNSGSEFLLSVRKLAKLWRNPQERHLRPFDRAVVETQQTLLRAIVNAHGCTDTECHIPIAAYGGMSDKIVPPSVSTWVFPLSGVVEGDHFSVVRPASRDASSYRVLKATLMAAASPEDAASATLIEASTERQGRVSVAPPYGLRDAPLQGRASLIASIMSSNEKSKVHVLAGLGGSGKSRLALEIAYRAQQEGWQVWWVLMTRINSCMREVANQLGAPDSQVERAWRGAGSATDLVWRFLNANPEPWLLIFDNADDPQMLGPLNSPVSDGTGWLRKPATSNGMIIVTSRDRNEATWGPWSVVHPVLPLEVDDGASMLMEHVGSVGGTNEQARLLSAELGGLPLALRAAAEYVKSVINTKVWQGQETIRDFEGYRAAVRRRFESPPGAYSHDLNEPMGLEIIQEVSDLSLKLLAHRGLTQAAPLLKLFACLNIAPIPYHILLNSDVLAESSLFTEFTAKQRLTVLDGLADLGLVEPYVIRGIDDPNLSHVLSLHPVFHGILRSDEDVQQRRTDYYGLNVRMLLAATHDFDPDYPENWEIWNIIAPHSIEVSRTSLLGAPQLGDPRVIGMALELARQTSRYLIVTGLLGPAHDFVLPIVAECQSFGFQQDDREILALRHEKARIALERGDPKAAEAELRQVIAGREQILGENDPDTLASGHKLAKAILEQGRWAEAEPLLRSIVLAENKVRGPEHSDTMVVRHSLARAILALKRAPEAEAMIRDILQVRNRIWSPATPETLFVRQTLARSLLEQGKWDEAEFEVRDALLEAAELPDAPVVLSLRHTLTTVLLMQGRVPEAVVDLTELLADRCQVLGPTHPETERTRRLLATTRAAIPDHPPEPDMPPSP
jgi:triacylglycerol esterase/lipase EstA (alpha/beta hydrolase family)